VGDGLTKPLAGQAFFKFVDDLGFARARAEESNRESAGHATGGGGSSAGIRAMALGSVLLSTAEGAPDVNEAGEEFSLIWTTGLLLVATGAVYAGQLFHSASKCCLKRPRESKESGHRPSLRRMPAESSDDESILVVSEAEESASDTKAPGRCEGASSDKKNGKAGVSAAGGSMSRSRDQMPVATGPSSNPLSSLTPEQGPPTSRPCSTSMSFKETVGHPQSWQRAAASSVLSGAAVMDASAAAAERGSLAKRPIATSKTHGTVFSGRTGERASHLQ
jgi:hypothetical protein